MSLNLFAISYVNPMSTYLPHYIKERVHVWNHEPRSIFNHMKHFSNHFKHLLHSAILKSENTKTLLLLAFTYKNPQNTIHHHYYHPSIFIYHHCILFTLNFAWFIILISFSHLVLDNHLVRLSAQSNLLVCRKSREGQGDKTHTTDSPRVRY